MLACARGRAGSCLPPPECPRAATLALAPARTNDDNRAQQPAAPKIGAWRVPPTPPTGVRLIEMSICRSESNRGGGKARHPPRLLRRLQSGRRALPDIPRHPARRDRVSLPRIRTTFGRKPVRSWPDEPRACRHAFPLGIGNVDDVFSAGAGGIEPISRALFPPTTSSTTAVSCQLARPFFSLH